MEANAPLILVKGAGDLGTGTAHRLRGAGFWVVMTDLPKPMAVRRAASFCRALDEGFAEVEGLVARGASPETVYEILERGEIPVLADADADIAKTLDFDGLVDAVMAKRNTGTSITDARAVIALGPGFEAGIDCHGVVETQRGMALGRLITRGAALPNTGIPGDVGGHTEKRIFRAPRAGVFMPLFEIGRTVREGAEIALVDGFSVIAPISGVVRGMLPPGTLVTEGMKAGDIDPRAGFSDWSLISDKSRAVAGGVLEGLLHFGVCPALCRRENRRVF